MSDLTTQTLPFTPELGDKVYWKIHGLTTEKVLHLQGLYLKDNGDGSTKVRMYQRNYQKLSTVLDVQTELLQPHTNLPEEFGDLLQNP